MSASSESERIPQRQLGELMTELGLISEEQLATVLEVQQQSKRPLGQIIVELGFASGAAVAHALAMQSGGALRTEYGFALGIHPEDGDPNAEETRDGLPKLRLAPTAVAPPARPSLEAVGDPQTDGAGEPETVAEEPILEAVPDAPTGPEHVDEFDEPEPVEATAAGEEVEALEAVDAAEPVEEPEAPE